MIWDVAICGGLTVARQASELASAAGRRCVPHCFSTGINLAASLHWMAALGPENAALRAQNAVRREFTRAGQVNACCAAFSRSWHHAASLGRRL